LSLQQFTLMPCRRSVNTSTHTQPVHFGRLNYRRLIGVITIFVTIITVVMLFTEEYSYKAYLQLKQRRTKHSVACVYGCAVWCSLFINTLWVKKTRHRILMSV